MAESQAPYNYTRTQQGLTNDLSEARLKPYLISAGHDSDYAFALYLYNARMAKAFLFPLHVLEVTLRNRINDIFSATFCDEWCHDPTFQRVLSEESIAALEKGISRAKTRSTADIVATLTFDFWSNLFRDEYDRPLWQTKMGELLPNSTKTRSEFQRTVKTINHFRNRIAHHEPVHRLNLSQMHTDLLETLSWLSSEAHDWVKHFSSVNYYLRTRPSANKTNGPSVSEKADTDFYVKKLLDTLDQLNTQRFILCEDDAGNIAAVIEMQHIARYLLSLKEDGDLMLSLNEHTYSDVIKYNKLSHCFIICKPEDELYKATSRLTGKKQYIVVSAQNSCSGIIARAHRKY